MSLNFLTRTLRKYRVMRLLNLLDLLPHNVLQPRIEPDPKQPPLASLHNPLDHPSPPPQPRVLCNNQNPNVRYTPHEPNEKRNKSNSPKTLPPKANEPANSRERLTLRRAFIRSRRTLYGNTSLRGEGGEVAERLDAVSRTCGNGWVRCWLSLRLTNSTISYCYV